MPTPPRSPTLVQVTADLLGVSAEQLSDGALLGGLLIAAASAAGMNSADMPIVRSRARGGLAAVLLLDDCHITAHALPERGLLLVDVLAPSARDGRRAVEVFTRRLAAREVREETWERGVASGKRTGGGG